jgi:hypothetical protein
MNSMNPALADLLRKQWEGMNNRWNQWVLSYARGQQFDLMKALGFEAPSWQDLAVLLTLLLCAGALAGAGWAWWDRRRQDPWQRLQQRVQARLLALGVAVQAHHAPRARATLVRAALGPRGEALAATLDALDAARYAQAGPAAAPQRAWWQDFKAAARALA